MIDRTSRDISTLNFAELTGIVPQLTTPSRNHGHLVDIWFGVQWQERDAEWEESFTRLSNGRRPDPDNPSFFGLFSHASSSGLIVARQVSADREVWRQVEDEARALITSVNLDIEARRTPPPSSPSSKGRHWALRVRDASAFFAALGWLGEPKQGLPTANEIPIRVSPSTPGGSR